MWLGVGLTPVADVAAVLDGAAAAEEEGLDAVALWDHYQSGRPEWAYVAGWAAWGAIATATTRVRLVPMVVNLLHHDLGRIAKETSERMGRRPSLMPTSWNSIACVTSCVRTTPSRLPPAGPRTRPGP